MKRGFRGFGWMSTFLVALLLAACSTTGSTDGTGNSAASSPEPTVEPSTVVIKQNTAPPPHSSATRVIAKVLPSVVNIKVKVIGTGLFGGLQNSKAEGSGVVISRNGVILTNNHVVQGALQVTVALNDGRKLGGTVVGTDATHDIAVVRVADDNLKPITVGNSSKLKLGDTVIALGFPLHLGGATVTEGIVSGLQRSVAVQGDNGTTEHLKDLIQTDAAINPGNSGGALVDATGRLMGVNTAAASAGSAENVGFSIAIDKALPIVHKIINAPTQGAFIGVQVVALDTQRFANVFNLPKGTTGAGVAGVISGSPADVAGIKQGDVIVKVDDHPIKTPDDLTSTLAGYNPGDKVSVTIKREGATKSVSITLIPRPADLQASPSP
jgi:S1-C subfamily serine protease